MAATQDSLPTNIVMTSSSATSVGSDAIATATDADHNDSYLASARRK